MKSGSELVAALSAIKVSTEDSWPPTPWAYMFGERRMLAATDGWVLVAVDVDRADGVDRPEAPKKIAGALSKWALMSAITSGTVAAAHLCGFAGISGEVVKCSRCKSRGKVDCDECNGSKEVEHECHCGHTHIHECEECGGSGKMPCPKCADRATTWQPAEFFGGVVNRQTLRAALAPLGLSASDGSVVVDGLKMSDGPSSTDCWRLVGDGWIVYAMGMRETSAAVKFEEPKTWAA